MEGARLKGIPNEVIERARKLLLIYLQTAEAQNLPFAEVVQSLIRGAPARQIAGVELSHQIATAQGISGQAACREGCAFCCILKGDDGGTITEAEARDLHAALIPLAGQPDGRAWHPRACPSLDPETRMCRAYEHRPMICRSYMSVDVTACETIAEGTPAPGTGVMGAQFTYLAVQALARVVLKGLSVAPTYSLAAVAKAAVEGEDIETALKAARHPTRALDEEKRRLSAGHGASL